MYAHYLRVRFYGAVFMVLDVSSVFYGIFWSFSGILIVYQWLFGFSMIFDVLQGFLVV